MRSMTVPPVILTVNSHEQKSEKRSQWQILTSQEPNRSCCFHRRRHAAQHSWDDWLSSWLQSAPSCQLSLLRDASTVETHLLLQRFCIKHCILLINHLDRNFLPGVFSDTFFYCSKRTSGANPNLNLFWTVRWTQVDKIRLLTFQ